MVTAKQIISHLVKVDLWHTKIVNNAVLYARIIISHLLVGLSYVL